MILGTKGKKFFCKTCGADVEAQAIQSDRGLRTLLTHPKNRCDFSGAVGRTSQPIPAGDEMFKGWCV
jgi:hypothetical protein